jgi:hypothetical protein
MKGSRKKRKKMTRNEMAFYVCYGKYPTSNELAQFMSWKISQRKIYGGKPVIL